jgi:hypothetical protein
MSLELLSRHERNLFAKCSSFQDRIDLANHFGRDSGFEENGYSLIRGGAAEVIHRTVQLIQDKPREQSFRMRPPLEQLTLDSPFMRYALERPLLERISAYLGFVPVLYEVELWVDRHRPGPYADNQLFHCDFESNSFVKVLLYCNRVSREAGATMVVSRSNSRQLRRKLNYRRPDKVRDQQIIDVVGKENIARFDAEAGDAILLDVGDCFHCGARVGPNLERVIVQFFYASPGSQGFAQGGPLFEHLLDPDLPALTRLALGDGVRGSRASILRRLWQRMGLRAPE